MKGLVLALAACATMQAAVIDFEGLAASSTVDGAPENPASVLSTQLNGLGIVIPDMLAMLMKICVLAVERLVTVIVPSVCQTSA